MDRSVIRLPLLACLCAAAPFSVAAHQMTVFASVDCETVQVEARFSNGNAVQLANVRVLDGNNVLLMTHPIGNDGTFAVPLESVDHAGGLLIEVDTGSHGNYWIVTPEDIENGCEE